jgi:hypothetical protein
MNSFGYLLKSFYIFSDLIDMMCYIVVGSHLCCYEHDYYGGFFKLLLFMRQALLL